MLNYTSFFFLVYGTLFGFITVSFAILCKLPVNKLVRFLEIVFSFQPANQITNTKSIVINVCGDLFQLNQSFKSRAPFILALGTCLLVSVLVFIDGCIFSTKHIYGRRLCSDTSTFCYLFHTRFTSFTPFYQYECIPDTPVIPDNVTANHAICYGVVLLEQTSIDILNQLGVCTGILSLIETVYPFAYRHSRNKAGRTVVIALLLILVIIEALVLASELNISFLTIILITLAEILLLTILFLHFRRSRDTKNRSIDVEIPLSTNETRPLLDH